MSTPARVALASALGAGLLMATAALARARPLPAATAPAPARPAQRPVPPVSEVERIFVAWDRDHDGQLSLAEFRTGTRQMQAALAERRLQARFDAMDRNHDGTLDAAEYRELPLVRRAGQQASAWAAHDRNADGRLDFGEYVELVRQLAAAISAGASQ